MAQARRHDYEGALTSYTAAIELLGIPADVKAMALFNRALAHVADGEDSKGVSDLEAVLAMDGEMITVNIKKKKKKKLARIEARIRKGKA